VNWKRRIRWVVSPVRGLVFRWRVTRDGKEVGRYVLQSRAIAAAVAGCNFEWDTMRQRSELLIQEKATGQFRDPRTYGDDPPESKG
jgi:hypothetical protein